MAKQTAAVVESKASWVERIKGFYDEVMAEMLKVTWPTKDELKASTQVVLLVLVLMAAIIYAYDVVSQLAIVGLFKIL